MGLGLIPIPLVDVSALTATQISMLQKLCIQYEVPFEEGDLKPLLMSLISAALPVLGIVGMSSLVKGIPGIGTLAGSASLSIIAGAITYAVGQTFAMHFATGGTLDNLDLPQAKAFFKQELDKGKSVVQALRDEFKAAKEEAIANKDSDK
jgi:uncharacterized protein (DUF697 family)